MNLVETQARGVKAKAGGYKNVEAIHITGIARVTRVELQWS